MDEFYSPREYKPLDVWLLHFSVHRTADIVTAIACMHPVGLTAKSLFIFDSPLYWIMNFMIVPVLRMSLEGYLAIEHLVPFSMIAHIKMRKCQTPKPPSTYSTRHQQKQQSRALGHIYFKWRQKSIRTTVCTISSRLLLFIIIIIKSWSQSKGCLDLLLPVAQCPSSVCTYCVGYIRFGVYCVSAKSAFQSFLMTLFALFLAFPMKPTPTS